MHLAEPTNETEKADREKHAGIPEAIAITTSILAAATGAFYLYTAYFGQRPAMLQRGPLLAIALLLIFISAPLRKKSAKGGAFAINCGLALIALGSVIYIVIREPTISRLMLIGTPLDLAVGTALTLLVLEATRRVVGLPMVILTVILMLYAVFGNYAPGILKHPGSELDRLISVSALSERGIFGSLSGVAATVIVIFLLFSAFLRRSGGEFFFIDLPNALLGGTRGGPAKIAVVGSCLFGSISGSGVANVVATGSFTIPLMKKSGYSPEMAAAIETSSSTAGQIMPPVMGVTAFVIAEMLGISYWAVCVAAFLPAILYYLSIFVTVDLEAAKRGLKGLPREMRPNVRKTLAEGWFLIFPLAVLVYLLIQKWSPMKAALYAIILTVAASMISRKFRLTPKKIFVSLSAGI